MAPVLRAQTTGGFNRHCQNPHASLPRSSLLVREGVAAVNERTCRPLVNDRANASCERCGVNASLRGLTTHHRVKRSQGGLWTPENCVRLCGHGTTPDGCHSWVEHNPNDAEAEGFHVRPWNNPADIPILRQGVLCFLDDVGGFSYSERTAS